MSCAYFNFRNDIVKTIVYLIIYASLDMRYYGYADVCRMNPVDQI
jgi:hypothetical protein